MSESDFEKGDRVVVVGSGPPIAGMYGEVQCVMSNDEICVLLDPDPRLERRTAWVLPRTIQHENEHE